MKKILGLIVLSNLICNFAYATGEYVEDGYHSQIPCFRFVVKSPSGQETPFNYKLIQASSGKKIQFGKVVANKYKENIIQWCDNDLSHVQKLGNFNFNSNYKLVIDGIKFKNYSIGTSIAINSATTQSSFVNRYSVYHTSSLDLVTMTGKDVHVGENVDIHYSDILQIDNASFEHEQFGTNQAFDTFPVCSVADPVCGDSMNYKSTDTRTWWGFSLFRKTFLHADLIIPENISSYHSINTRNLKIQDEAKDFDHGTNHIGYDNDDKDTNKLIELNINYNHKNSDYRANNLRSLFSGFCSGIGVIDGVVYATCRTDTEISPTSNLYPLNVTQQIPTYLSYKTACAQYEEVYPENPSSNITSSLLRTSNGILQCINYKQDFPQGEYLKTCTGVNYKPDSHELITDCYDNNGAIKHSVRDTGSTSVTTQHYKNVNGELVAY